MGYFQKQILLKSTDTISMDDFHLYLYAQELKMILEMQDGSAFCKKMKTTMALMETTCNVEWILQNWIFCTKVIYTQYDQNKIVITKGHDRDRLNATHVVDLMTCTLAAFSKYASTPSTNSPTIVLSPTPITALTVAHNMQTNVAVAQACRLSLLLQLVTFCDASKYRRRFGAKYRHEVALMYVANGAYESALPFFNNQLNVLRHDKWTVLVHHVSEYIYTCQMASGKVEDAIESCFLLLGLQEDRIISHTISNKQEVILQRILNYNAENSIHRSALSTVEVTRISLSKDQIILHYFSHLRMNIKLNRIELRLQRIDDSVSSCNELPSVCTLQNHEIRYGACKFSILLSHFHPHLLPGGTYRLHHIEFWFQEKIVLSSVWKDLQEINKEASKALSFTMPLSTE